MTAPLSQIYTLAEAEEKLRMKPNALGRLARRHGLCSANGRNLLFSEQDLVDLWEIMRVAAKESIRPAHVSLSEIRMMELAKKLTAKKPRRRLNR
ncbi:hypothetical protein SAMN05428967_2268 [Phyllobacterium sp. YR620]|uniref:hypothetical protein n=1 Tax=Phyllobacterium sp. YR620 TaxID=1881066 RepID=UPI000889B52E|nr:hypothetical protein [Phyllobacterium sp. YR620]SDP47151.1 hypothetical protein SAMN05428967_2268 [Phyllobacterium sp. YR620]